MHARLHRDDIKNVKDVLAHAAALQRERESGELARRDGRTMMLSNAESLEGLTSEMVRAIVHDFTHMKATEKPIPELRKAYAAERAASKTEAKSSEIAP